LGVAGCCKGGCFTKGPATVVGVGGSKVGAKWSKLKSGAQQKVVKAAAEENPRRGCEISQYTHHYQTFPSMYIYKWVAQKKNGRKAKESV